MSESEPGKRPKLVLHIGAHKTGTSALQVFLQQANPRLMEMGWVFAPQPGGHLNWAPMTVLRETANGEGQFLLDQPVFQAFLTRLKQRQRHLIASAEDLFFLEQDEIERFAAGLRPLAEDITIIAYLRRQDRMALSQWAQGGQTIQSASVFGCQTSQLRPMTAQMFRYLDYAARLDHWQAAFPGARVIARTYDRAEFPGGDVARDFMAQLGIVLGNAIPPGDVNKALGATAVQFLYWLRDEGFTQAEIQAILRRNLVEDSGDRALPARSEAEALVAVFAQSNRLLATRMGVAEAFDGAFDDYPEHATFKPLDDAFKLRNLLALVRSLRDGLGPNR